MYIYLHEYQYRNIAIADLTSIISGIVVFTSVIMDGWKKESVDFKLAEVNNQHKQQCERRHIDFDDYFQWLCFLLIL